MCRFCILQNYFALNNKCHIFVPQVRARIVQSGDENFEGGLITALCVFQKVYKNNRENFSENEASS